MLLLEITLILENLFFILHEFQFHDTNLSTSSENKAQGNVQSTWDCTEVVGTSRTQWAFCPSNQISQALCPPCPHSQPFRTSERAKLGKITGEKTGVFRRAGCFPDGRSD